MTAAAAAVHQDHLQSQKEYDDMKCIIIFAWGLDPSNCVIGCAIFGILQIHIPGEKQISHLGKSSVGQERKKRTEEERYAHPLF